MIKKLFTALYADDGLLFFDEDSGSVRFCCDELCIVSVSLNNIYLNNNFDEDDPDTIIFVRLLAWREELLAIAWHPKRWWSFCMSEDEKKEIEPIFTE